MHYESRLDSMDFSFSTYFEIRSGEYKNFLDTNTLSEKVIFYQGVFVSSRQDLWVSPTNAGFTKKRNVLDVSLKRMVDGVSH